MKFEEALVRLRNGVRVRRAMWRTDTYVQIRHGHIHLVAGQGLEKCWDCQEVDLLAEDWEETNVLEQ